MILRIVQRGRVIATTLEPPVKTFWIERSRAGRVMLTWNGSPINYDALGNMKNDPSIGGSGGTSLTFDERNHLSVTVGHLSEPNDKRFHLR